MKNAKTLNHTSLMAQTMELFAAERLAARKFRPDVRMIKRAIQSLIETEHIARVGPDTYEYVT
jgi:hypothetical protein